MDFHGFYTGQVMDAYEFLGAHAVAKGVVFRAFAPGAAGMCVMWEGHEVEMHRIAEDGSFFEVWIEDAKPGDAYEHRVYLRQGGYQDHCDPYGFGMEVRPDHRSIVRSLEGFRWRDAKWMGSRTDCSDRPLNIYELHAGSWRRHEDESWLTYEELAKVLPEYVVANGYTHVELMPLAEHPVDESWGYQQTGFYAPTSRYGTPDQLRILIDALHRAGVGVLIDFVPVHFATDPWALGNYDGTALYEFPNDAVGVSEWGSYNFMHSRGEVRSFLQSNANYWLREFHADGLRMDAISRIIYWMGDENRGVNGNAVDFIRHMNSELKRLNPGCMLCAEDSTNFNGTTRPASEGGLGFDYKWDMGWMHDTLEFFQTAPEFRPQNYHKLTFSMMYYYDERHLLPLSHDEVVHGKATILQKMSGPYEGKFAQGRALFLYMACHPGKKLDFMGNEFGQLREWDEKREQDWLLLDYPVHVEYDAYMRELWTLYGKTPALWERDFDRAGFAWLDCHQEARCLYAFERRGATQRVACVMNLSDDVAKDYAFEVPGAASVKVLLDTDWSRFGGSTSGEKSVCSCDDGVVTVTLQPESGMLLLVE